MSRMHSSRKGKAGSQKPLESAAVSWVPYKQKELELLIAKLAKSGMGPSQIGLHLRDSYGIPDVRALLGKSLTAILESKKLLKKLPEDINALIVRSIVVRKHLTKNKSDLGAKHGMILIESKIRRLAKYYKREGKLPADWKFNIEKAELYLE